jgi:Leucine rich repeat variant
MTNITSIPPSTFGEAADPATPAERLRELAQHPDLAPIVAANVGVSAELLREIEARIVETLPMPVDAAIALMTHGTPTIATNHYRALGLRADNPTLAAIAGNPNAPTDTLLRLAGAFPAQFCANPIFPLLLLENPNLPGEMPLPIVRSLLRYAGVPRTFLEWIASYGMPEVNEAARLHVAIAGEAGPDWRQLAQAEIWKTNISESDDLLLELLGLGAVPEWMLALLAGSADKAVRRAVARSPGASKAALKPFRRAGASSDLAGYAPPDRALDPAVLEWLAMGGRYARALAARNPGTPAAIPEQLAADVERAVRQSVARNPAAPPHLLDRLAGDRTPDVRQAVARNAATPIATLEQLAGDRAKDVRWTLARNPRAPRETLERLARDAHTVVRQAVARNPATPANLLDILADDEQRAVRLMVARAFGAPASTLERLAADPDPEIGAAVARHPNLPPTVRKRLLASNATAKRAKRKTTDDRSASQRPSDLVGARDLGEIERLAGDASSLVRAELAASAGVPAAILRRLAEDSSAHVRAAVARNPATPLDQLQWLAEDDVWAVHRAVAQNPRTPAAILAKFAEDYSWSNMRVRVAVVRNPNVSAAILEHLAGDLSVDVRREVMRHPATPSGARARILISSLEMCTRTSESFYHVLALAHPDAPAAYVESRISSPEWLERYAITRNPRAPSQILAALADDGNRLVRASARAALAEVRVES